MSNCETVKRKKCLANEVWVKILIICTAGLVQFRARYSLPINSSVRRIYQINDFSKRSTNKKNIVVGRKTNVMANILLFPLSNAKGKFSSDFFLGKLGCILLIGLFKNNYLVYSSSKRALSLQHYVTCVVLFPKFWFLLKTIKLINSRYVLIVCCVYIVTYFYFVIPVFSFWNMLIWPEKLAFYLTINPTQYCLWLRFFQKCFHKNLLKKSCLEPNWIVKLFYHCQ